jgi:hypothetical protein
MVNGGTILNGKATQFVTVIGKQHLTSLSFPEISQSSLFDNNYFTAVFFWKL